MYSHSHYEDYTIFKKKLIERKVFIPYLVLVMIIRKY